MSLRTVTLILLVVCVITCALITYFVIAPLAQPRIVAAQPEPFVLAVSFIPAYQGDAAGWVYIEAASPVTTSCSGCTLGATSEQRSARGVVRTQAMRAIWPGWQVTTTTTDGRTATYTHGAVVRFPWVTR